MFNYMREIILRFFYIIFTPFHFVIDKNKFNLKNNVKNHDKQNSKILTKKYQMFLLKQH